MMEISVRSNIKEIQKSLNDFAYKQVPFAVSLAATATAKKVQAAEVDNFLQALDRPTPFTQRSVIVKPARKGNPVAMVLVKDIAAAYLAPYEFGGPHKLNGPKMMAPRELKTNQYGNLPKGTLARMKGRSDVFIGVVKTKGGKAINGVWQRPVKASTAKRGRKGSRGLKANTTQSLKLLVALEEPQQVKQRLNYMELAERTVEATFNKEFERALAKAIATAK